MTLASISFCFAFFFLKRAQSFLGINGITKEENKLSSSGRKKNQSKTKLKKKMMTFDVKEDRNRLLHLLDLMAKNKKTSQLKQVEKKKKKLIH